MVPWCFDAAVRGSSRPSAASRDLRFAACGLRPAIRDYTVPIIFDTPTFRNPSFLTRIFPFGRAAREDLMPWCFDAAVRGSSQPSAASRDLRFAACGLRSAICDLRPTACDPRPATSDPRPAFCGLRPATSDQRPATSVLRPATRDQRSAACDLRPAACDPRFAIRGRLPTADC